MQSDEGDYKNFKKLAITLPCSARDICALMAKKCRVECPENYSLFEFKDGKGCYPAYVPKDQHASRNPRT